MPSVSLSDFMPPSRAIVEEALRQCRGLDPSTTLSIINATIPQLRGLCLSDAHDACDQQTGLNLASLAIHSGSTWCMEGNSVFRQLVVIGFNIFVPDQSGCAPALRALKWDRVAMGPEDFQWAFENGLDALAQYQDPPSAQSLLSVDFTSARHYENNEAYLKHHLGERLSAQDPQTRNHSLTMLRSTAHSAYGDLLSSVERAFLDVGIPKLAASSARRI